MLRRTLIALSLFAAACTHEAKPIMAPGETPPLPPASGTPVGYLLDNAAQLKLTDDQIEKLQKLDNSLSAQNDAIDTQLREIEKPEEDPDEEKPKKGEAPKPKNNAPGAFAVHSTEGSDKLHAAKDANNKDALGRAFAILDPEQQAAARKLLDARGVAAPGAAATKPEPAHQGADGVPLEP